MRTQTRHSLRLTLLAILALAPFAVVSPAQAGDEDAAPDFVPGRALVRFRRGASPASEAAALQAHGARVEEVLPELGIVVLALPPQASPRAFAHAFAGLPSVEFAEPDWLYAAEDVTPNDDSYGKQWHLPKIACPQAAASTTGDASVVIAILDTGVDGAHADLASKMVAGWNFYDGNSDTADVHGHGTAVAGSAAAATDNAMGVAGVAWNCKLMP